MRILILPNKSSPVNRTLRFMRFFGKIIVTKIDLLNLSKACRRQVEECDLVLVISLSGCLNRCLPRHRSCVYSPLVCIPFWCKKSNRNWDSTGTCHCTNWPMPNTADPEHRTYHTLILQHIGDETKISFRRKSQRCQFTDTVEEWNATAVLDGSIDATLDSAQIFGVEIKIFQWSFIVEVALATIRSQRTQLSRRHRLVNIYFHKEHSIVDQIATQRICGGASNHIVHIVQKLRGKNGVRRVVSPGQRKQTCH